MFSSGMVTIPSHGRGWFIVVYPPLQPSWRKPGPRPAAKLAAALVGQADDGGRLPCAAENSGDLGMELGRAGVEAYSDVNDDAWLKKRWKMRMLVAIGERSW